MARFAVVTCVLVCALAAFIMWPAPDLPEDVILWREEGKTFKFKSYNIFYKDLKGEGPSSSVLVILHGYPTCSYDFAEVIDGLLEGHGRIIAPDFLGFGLSDKPAGYKYSVMDMANMIGSLLSHLEVASFHILAHDLGDTVAQEIVARYNEDSFYPGATIESVCLMNGGILPEHHRPRLVQKLLLNPYSAPFVMRLMNYYAFSRALGETFGQETQPTDGEFREHWALVRYNDGHLVQDGLIRYILERAANRDRWVYALSETKLPLYLIYGASDPINPPDTFLRDYRKLIPNSGVMELPGYVGHYVHLEYPEGVLRAYLEFLESVRDDKTRAAREAVPETGEETVKGDEVEELYPEEENGEERETIEGDEDDEDDDEKNKEDQIDILENAEDAQNGRLSGKIPTVDKDGEEGTGDGDIEEEDGEILVDEENEEEESNVGGMPTVDEEEDHSEDTGDGDIEEEETGDEEAPVDEGDQGKKEGGLDELQDAQVDETADEELEQQNEMEDREETEDDDGRIEVEEDGEGVENDKMDGREKKRTNTEKYEDNKERESLTESGEETKIVNEEGKPDDIDDTEKVQTGGEDYESKDEKLPDRSGGEENKGNGGFDDTEREDDGGDVDDEQKTKTLGDQQGEEKELPSVKSGDDEKEVV